MASVVRDQTRNAASVGTGPTGRRRRRARRGRPGRASDRARPAPRAANSCRSCALVGDLRREVAHDAPARPARGRDGQRRIGRQRRQRQRARRARAGAPAASRAAACGTRGRTRRASASTPATIGRAAQNAGADPALDHQAAAVAPPRRAPRARHGSAARCRPDTRVRSTARGQRSAAAAQAAAWRNITPAAAATRGRARTA